MMEIGGKVWQGSTRNGWFKGMGKKGESPTIGEKAPFRRGLPPCWRRSTIIGEETPTKGEATLIHTKNPGFKEKWEPSLNFSLFNSLIGINFLCNFTLKNFIYNILNLRCALLSQHFWFICATSSIFPYGTSQNCFHFFIGLTTRSRVQILTNTTII